MNREQRRLEENKLKKKNMMLRQIQKEIKKLENEIKYSKVTNAKIYALRGLKMALRTGQLVAPYAATLGLTFSLFSICGSTPFVMDNHKQKLETMKEIDNLGNIRYEQQYDEFKNAENIISYYSKWSLGEDGFYSRYIETYSIGDITEEKVTELLIKTSGGVLLKDLFGDPINKKTESKNNITEEDIESEEFLQALIYSKEDDNYIVIKESIEDNFVSTLFWLFVSIICELLPILWRIEGSDFDYIYCIREIIENNPTLDLDEISKKLAIKKANYDRLTR